MKKKECQNCRFAHPSLLGWIFCREPERMKDHPKDHTTSKAPGGGYPQSLNHSCPAWKKAFDKHRVELIITDITDGTPKDFADRIKQCLELSGYEVEVGGWN